MNDKNPLSARVERAAELVDQLRVKRHLLARDGRDLLERLERRLTATEHRLGRATGYRAQVGRMLHQTHDVLRRLRERAREDV